MLTPLSMSLTNLSNTQRIHLAMLLMDCWIVVFVNDRNDAWELLVRWSGFTDMDNTWEPVIVLLEEVTSLVQAFVASHITDPDVQKMASALDIPSEGGNVAGPRQAIGSYGSSWIAHT